MVIGEERARSLLAKVAGRVGAGLILWRGPELTGSDIDLLMMPEAELEVARLLAGAGLSASPGDPGHVVWSDGVDGGLELDLLPAGRWPAYYPSLPGVIARLRAQPSGPPVPSPEDRLLILAAEAVLGRPLSKIERRARPLLAEAGALERLHGLARSEHSEPLALLIGDLERLLARARRGRLPYRAAAGSARRSRPARAALQARVVRAIRRRAPRLRRPRRGLIVAVSGMDGAGKSTAARTAHASLLAAGLPASLSWGRFVDTETDVLIRLARPVKRLLGDRQARVADHVAAGGAAAEHLEAPPSARRSILGWGWVAVVAAVNARGYRRVAGATRNGHHLVCDRWLPDSLVDLELRYGRHSLGALILRRAIPRADLNLLLEIDAATAAQRNPGDQSERILRAMERAYEKQAQDLRLDVVDAAAPIAEVQAAIRRRVDALVARRRPVR